MFSDVIFSLRGVGYLHDVNHKDDGMYAKINVINQFNSGLRRPDDIWIECSVKDSDVLRQMSEMENSLQLHKTIIIHFEAEYSGFDYCHYGRDQDPDSIVLLKGNLRLLREYFINGVSQKNKVSSKTQKSALLFNKPTEKVG